MVSRFNFHLNQSIDINLNYPSILGKPRNGGSALPPVGPMKSSETNEFGSVWCLLGFTELRGIPIYGDLGLVQLIQDVASSQKVVNSMNYRCIYHSWDMFWANSAVVMLVKNTK